jgi:hypothetical protein
MLMKTLGLQNHSLPSVGMAWWRLERSVIVVGKRTAGMYVASRNAGTHPLKNHLAD